MAMDERLLKAIANLSTRAPDLYAKVAGMDIVPSDQATSIAMDINTGELSYNPEFMTDLDQDGIDYMVAFIAQLIDLGSYEQAKRKDIDHSLWGTATNLVINAKLAERGYTPLKISLRDDELGALGVEKVYERLVEDHAKRTGQYGDLMKEIMDRSAHPETV